MTLPVKTALLLGTALFFYSGTLCAQYTIVLKNGRQLTVQSYREEGGMIKFQGLGGEMGISRDQVQAIVQSDELRDGGMVVPEREPVEARAPDAVEREVEAPTETAPDTDEKPLTAEEKRAKEEKEYQVKIGEITDQLRAARARYSSASGGTGGREPTLLQTEEAIKARTEDLKSRLRDAQHNPAEPEDAGGVKLMAPSPFTGQPPVVIELPPPEVIRQVDTPPPAYTEKERELSDLRSRIAQLEKERERLIQEMKQKDFDTSSVFLD